MTFHSMTITDGEDAVALLLSEILQLNKAILVGLAGLVGILSR